MAKNLNFNVGDGLTLTLQDLWASVEVRKGQIGKATVNLSGDDKLLEQVEVTQSSPDQLLIKGSGEDGGGLTVINSRGGSISVGNIRGSGIVIGGSVVGRTIVSGGDLVVVNGKVVSGGNKVTVIEGGEMPTITIVVPAGTNIEAYDVQSVNSRGLGGKLDVSLSGQGEATVDYVNGMKVRCSGQSHANITGAAGNIKASCSGQSNVSVVGSKLGDVEAEASGQSSVTVNGSCEDCDVDASGMSHVTVTHATGKVHKHSSGMSHVSVGQ